MEESQKRIDSEITESNITLENIEVKEKNNIEEKKGGVLLDKISGKNRKKIKEIEEPQIINNPIGNSNIFVIAESFV